MCFPVHPQSLNTIVDKVNDVISKTPKIQDYENIQRLNIYSLLLNRGVTDKVNC